MRSCVLTQKSEEAPASSASLLATPMNYRMSVRAADEKQDISVLWPYVFLRSDRLFISF